MFYHRMGMDTSYVVKSRSSWLFYGEMRHNERHIYRKFRPSLYDEPFVKKVDQTAINDMID